MTRKLWVHFFIVCLPFAGTAQRSTEKKIKMGLETGLNFAFLNRFGPYNEDDLSTNFLRLRAGASVFLAYQILPILRVQTGIGYANYGGQFREEAGTVYTPVSGGGSYQTTKSTIYYKDVYRMDFLEIPLKFKVFLLPKKQISPYLVAGMSYGILLRASNYYNFNDVGVMQMDDIKPYVKDHFVNGLLGAGVEVFKRKRVSFGLEIRYHQSLTKVFEYEELDFAYPDPDDDTREYVATYNVNATYHNLFINLFSSLNF